MAAINTAAFGNAVDSARRAYENLNERERRLVVVLGAVLAAIVVLLPVYLLTSAISDIETENRELASVLRDISRARPTLAERAAAREAAERKYDQPAPELRRFVEAKGGEVGVAVRETTGQPEKVSDGYVRKHLRVNLSNVELRPVVLMMEAIENSPYPIAINRLQIDHYQQGGNYSVQMDVIAFERQGRRGGGEGDDEEPSSARVSKRPGGRAGPPAP